MNNLQALAVITFLAVLLVAVVDVSEAFRGGGPGGRLGWFGGRGRPGRGRVPHGGWWGRPGRGGHHGHGGNKPPTDATKPPPGPCEYGEPLVNVNCSNVVDGGVDSNRTEIILDDDQCPSGFYCEFASDEISGVCCPQNDSCTPGDVWVIDACTTCSCPDWGVEACSTQLCPDLDCGSLGSHVPTGKCCEECLPDCTLVDCLPTAPDCDGAGSYTPIGYCCPICKPEKCADVPFCPLCDGPVIEGECCPQC